MTASHCAAGQCPSSLSCISHPAQPAGTETERKREIKKKIKKKSTQWHKLIGKLTASHWAISFCWKYLIIINEVVNKINFLNFKTKSFQFYFITSFTPFTYCCFLSPNPEIATTEMSI